MFHRKRGKDVRKKMLGDAKFEMLSLCTKFDAYIAFSLSEHIFLYESILALGC